VQRRRRGPGCTSKKPRNSSVAAYRRRLSDALARLEVGDHRYLTAPDRDSDHTAWFELHQHLINLLGRTRQQEEAAGRAV
jgi:hypothetical protein